MRRRGRQTGIDAVLASLERRFDGASRGRYLQVRVSDAWSDVAGPTVAEHTAGVFLRGTELNVQVDSNVWATELSALAGSYIEAINSRLGKDVVSTIRFTVSRSVARTREEKAALEEAEDFYRPEPSRAVPLTPTERAQVEASAAVIEDEELREAAVKATIASMEWQKGQRITKTREKP